MTPLAKLIADGYDVKAATAIVVPEEKRTMHFLYLQKGRELFVVADVTGRMIVEKLS